MARKRIVLTADNVLMTEERAVSRKSQSAGSASVYVQHERWTADRWAVMFQVDGAVRMKFMIGAACSTKQEAERLRDDFEKALSDLKAIIQAERCKKDYQAQKHRKLLDELIG